jgi:hypothetical protein
MPSFLPENPLLFWQSPAEVTSVCDRLAVLVDGQPAIG